MESPASSRTIPTPTEQAEALAGLSQLTGFMNRLQSVPKVVTFVQQGLQAVTEIEKRRSDAEAGLEAITRKANAQREQGARALDAAREQAAGIIRTATDEAASLTAAARAELERLTAEVAALNERRAVAEQLTTAAEEEHARVQARLREAIRQSVTGGRSLS